MRSNLLMLALAFVLGLGACGTTYTASGGGSAGEAVGPADYGDDEY